MSLLGLLIVDAGVSVPVKVLVDTEGRHSEPGARNIESFSPSLGSILIRSPSDYVPHRKPSPLSRSTHSGGTKQRDGLDIRPRLQSLTSKFLAKWNLFFFFFCTSMSTTSVRAVYQPSCWEAWWIDAHASPLQNSQDDGLMRMT